MMKQQQIQVHELCEQNGIKPAAKQTSTDARIAALQAKHKMSKRRERLPKNQHGKETEGILL